MPLEYYRASSLSDALQALSQADGMGRLLSGGQSLVPMLNLRLLPANVLIDIKRIAALKHAEGAGQAMIYGACVTHAQIEDGVVPDAANGFLRFVAAGIAYRAVRNRGTLGGALSLSDASTDWVTAMIAADATVHAESAKGTRRIPAAAFVLGPYQTALRLDEEVLTAVEVPRFSNSSRWGYYKVMQKPGEYASSLAGVVIDRDRGYTRAVLGGANRAPVVLKRTGELLGGAVAWSHALPVDLERTMRADLVEAARRGEDWELRSWITSIQRASHQALA